MKRSLQLNPLNKPATWDDIRHQRDQREQASLSVNGLLVDANEISVKRIELAIEQFDDLPTLDDQGRLTWKMADNSLVPLYLPELRDLLAGIKRGLAIRAARLHVIAEQLRAQLPDVTKGIVEDDATWQ